MAKKVISGAEKGKGKSFTKVIKMVKSPKTGAYTFKEDIVPKDKTDEFFTKK